MCNSLCGTVFPSIFRAAPAKYRKWSTASSMSSRASKLVSRCRDLVSRFLGAYFDRSAHCHEVAVFRRQWALTSVARMLPSRHRQLADFLSGPVVDSHQEYGATGGSKRRQSSPRPRILGIDAVLECSLRRVAFAVRVPGLDSQCVDHARGSHPNPTDTPCSLVSLRTLRSNRNNVL